MLVMSRSLIGMGYIFRLTVELFKTQQKNKSLSPQHKKIYIYILKRDENMLLKYIFKKCCLKII